MNVFERVEKLNARIRELETQLRAYELEKALREAIEVIEGTGLDASNQRAAIAKATGQEI
jgi:predicted  nucleic acid-binding Zn-ribbon protein